jgi:hypothetical protein
LSGSGGQVARPKASAGDVEAFLCLFIETMDRTGGLTLWANQKNKAFEDRTGFIKQDAEDLVRLLGHKNYNKGPEGDDNPTRPQGQVWVFHTEYLGEPIYLKLKLVGTAGSPTQAACLSFHEPEREMKTPLKVNGRGNMAPARRQGRHGR